MTHVVTQLGSGENKNQNILKEIHLHLKEDQVGLNFKNVKDVLKFSHEAAINNVPFLETYDFVCAATSDDTAGGFLWQNIREGYKGSGSEEVINSINSISQLDQEEMMDNLLLNSPTFDDSIFQNLPKLLLDACSPFKDKRQRDIVFTGSLGTLSGCIPNVIGVYDQSAVRANLFILIVTPPASGKGVLKFSKALASRCHYEIRKQSEAAYNQYLSEKKPGQVSPIEPKRKVLFIPGDVSKAKLIQHLDWNNGSGIVFETELDTIGNAQKQDWGPSSDVLRKIYHNEPISVSRKNLGEYVEVDSPYPSYIASGTPDQVPKLISSPDDGLMSRFSFYTFIADCVWKRISGNDGENLTNYFNNLADKVYAMTVFLESSPTEVTLTESQWDKLNSVFELRVKESVIFNGKKSRSLVIRQGLMLYKICMVLTAIRKFESANNRLQVTCLDADFESACLIVDVFYQHSMLMLQSLPKRGQQTNAVNLSHKKLYEALDLEFKRSDAIRVGKNLGISEPTVNRFLSNCSDILIERTAFRCYRKLSSLKLEG